MKKTISFLKTVMLFLTASFMLSGCASLTSPMRVQQPPAKLVKLESASAVQPTGRTVVCRIASGTGVFKNGLRDIAQTQFYVTDAQRLRVDINSRQTGAQMGILAYLDMAGQRMLFCPWQEEANSNQRIPCASLYAMDQDYEVGFKRTLDIPRSIIGGHITCAFDAARLKKI